MSIAKVDLTSIPVGRRDLIMSKSAAKILVITATQADIETFPFFRLFGRHLGFAAERHGLQNRRIAETTIKKFEPENMGVAAGISFLSALELEIPLGIILPPPPFAMNVCKNTVAIVGLITVKKNIK